MTYLFLLFSLTAAVPSCGFLDVVPPETEGPDDFLLEAEDALQYLYGCYGTLQNNNTKVLSYNTLAFGSDEIVGPETVYDNLGEFFRTDYTAVNVGLQLGWDF